MAHSPGKFSSLSYRDLWGPLGSVVDVGMLPGACLGIAFLDAITIGIKVLTRYLEDGPVGKRFHLMGLTGDMPDDISRTEPLLMRLPNVGIHPSMDELALSHVPRLVFEDVIVHAGLRALPKDQQLTAIELIIREN